MSPRRLALILVVPLALAGCGGSEVAGSLDNPDAETPVPTFTLDTEAAPTQVTAGGTAAITCLARDEEGTLFVRTGWTLVVEPSEGVTVDDRTLTLTRAGTVQVACALGELVDATPVSVEVRPAAPVTAVASVTPAVTEAGAPSTVACALEDAYGNAVTDVPWTAVVDPAAAVTVTGASIATELAGDYTVLCDAGALASDPVPWTVTAAAPVTFELAFDPVKLAYRKDEGITVTGVLTDAYGNRTEGVAVTDVAATPAEPAIVFGDGSKIRFTEEGFYEVSAASADYPALTATADLVVDQTPPAIVITTPARGLVKDGEPSVLIEGTVSDNLGKVQFLSVAGSPYPIPPEGGAFSATVPLVYGINTLVVAASDPYENEGVAARSVMWSDAYYPLDPAAWGTDRVVESVIVHLDQDAVDDGVHDPSELNDLATILEVVLESFDIASLVDNPIATLLGIKILLEDVTFTNAKVTLTTKDDALGVKLTMDQLSAAIGLDGPLGKFDAVFYADGLDLSMDLLVDAQDGALVVEAENSSLELDDTSVGFPQDPTGLGDDLVNALVAVIEPTLIALIEQILPAVLEDQLANLVGSLGDALTLEQPLEIPAIVEGTSPNVVDLRISLSDTILVPGYFRLILDAMADAAAPVPPQDVLGAIRFSGCGPKGNVPVYLPSPLVAGVHDDFVNQLLYAVWAGGTATLDLGPEAADLLDLSGFGIEISKLKVNPLLPPMLDACDGTNTVQLGSLYVEATMGLLGQTINLAMWVHTQAPLYVVPSTSDTGATVLGIEIGAFNPFVIELETNEGPFEDDPEGLKSLFRDELLPLLLDQVAGGALEFELPSIDLHDLADFFPPGTALEVDVEKIGQEKAYLTIEGGLK